MNVFNGVIMPNGFKNPVGVYDCKGLFVDLSTERGIICEKIIIQNIEYRNEVVLYLGEIHTGHWGNFFIDNISRLWYFIQSNKKIKIAYCGRNFKEGTFGNASNNAFHLLSLFGISRDDFIDVRKPMQFNQVIVPQKSFIHHEYVTS